MAIHLKTADALLLDKLGGHWGGPLDQPSVVGLAPPKRSAFDVSFIEQSPAGKLPKLTGGI